LTIKKARPGNTVGDIGNVIERYLSKRGFGVIKELCGPWHWQGFTRRTRSFKHGKREKEMN